MKERMHTTDLVARPTPAPSALRQCLELAAEARHRGDLGAANVHELDALRELRRQLAEAREARRHG